MGETNKAEDDAGGAVQESKLNLDQLREAYKKMGVSYDEVFAGIKDVIIKTILSVESPIVMASGTTKHKNVCFEVYGFDVLIDANLKALLLEVNVSPSLSSSSILDKQVKTLLLSDSLYLVGFKLFDRKKMEQEKAKKNKNRLLGFESSKNNNPDTANVFSTVKSLNDPTAASPVKTQPNDSRYRFTEVEEEESPLPRGAKQDSSIGSRPGNSSKDFALQSSERLAS